MPLIDISPRAITHARSALTFPFHSLGTQEAGSSIDDEDYDFDAGDTDDEDYGIASSGAGPTTDDYGDYFDDYDYGGKRRRRKTGLTSLKAAARAAAQDRRRGDSNARAASRGGKLRRRVRKPRRRTNAL